MNGDDDHDGEVEEDDEDDKLVTTFNIKSIYKKIKSYNFGFSTEPFHIFLIQFTGSISKWSYCGCLVALLLACIIA